MSHEQKNVQQLASFLIPIDIIGFGYNTQAKKNQVFPLAQSYDYLVIFGYIKLCCTTVWKSHKILEVNVDLSSYLDNEHIQYHCYYQFSHHIQLVINYNRLHFPRILDINSKYLLTVIIRDGTSSYFYVLQHVN